MKLILAGTESEQPQPNKNPYDKCLTCAHIGQTCDGPNFLAMTEERWAQWCRIRKDMLGLTNSKLAEESDVPTGTVARVLSGRGGDIRISTMRGITKCLVGGSWGMYPCHDPGDQTQDDKDLAAALANAEKRLQESQAAYDRAVTGHQQSLADAKSEGQKKADYLKEQIEIRDRQLAEKDESIRRKEKLITKLFAVIVAVMVAIIGVLLLDVLNPGIGWLRAML